jgi:DNA-binding SARP family transcriptional activator/tetratricopeptide (TPR) repeat protein
VSREASLIAFEVFPLRIALLGQPRVLCAQGTRAFPLPRKTLNVLAYLILHRKRPPTRESLAFALFPDEEEDTARASLRRNLSYLLSSLPRAPESSRFVSATDERVAWNPESPAVVDVVAFEDAVASGRDGDAIAEYGGELLPTLYDDWTMRDRERLRDLYHETIARSIGRARSLRHFDRATELAHRLLDDDPWREDIVRQLMAIRYESGDRAGALAVFERLASRLRTEMQAEPMPETFALRETLLRGGRLATSEPGLPAAPAAGVTTPLTLPFVGRDAAMETALERWHAAADGRVNLLFLSGEAGVGKSRFASELARAIEREGGFVVRGETSAGGEHRAYEAFVDALRGALSERGRRSSRREPDIWSDVLERLLDDHASATFIDDRSARVRLFDSVRRGLADLSRARPLVVVLEDLHWAGAATIDLLEFVALRLRPAHVLIVATLRSDELPRAHPLRALRRQLESHGIASEIALARLDAKDASHAVRSGAAAQVDDPTVAEIVAWAEGVPLLLAEAVRDLAAGRSFKYGGIPEIVESRIERLSSNAETVLIYGAVLGTRFELVTLSAAIGWQDDEVVEALGESIELGLVRATARAPGLAFNFTHHLVQVAASGRIAPSERATIHGLVARALAAQPGSTGARAPEVARHFKAAGERRRAAEHYLHAARYALDVFANADARDAATEGLALAAEDDRPLRYDLVDVRERSLGRIGPLEARRRDALALRTLAGDEERACQALERIFDAFGEEPTRRNEAVAEMQTLASHSERNAAIFEYASAMLALRACDYPETCAAALRASGHFERSGDAREAISARLLQIRTLGGQLGGREQAREAMREVRTILADSEDLPLLYEFHFVAAMIESAASETARDEVDRALDLALRIGSRYAEGNARFIRGFYLSQGRDHGAAIRETELAYEALRAVGNVPGTADTLLNAVAYYSECGDFAAAERLLGELDPVALERSVYIFRSTFQRGELLLRSGRFAEAESYLQIARELAPSVGTPWIPSTSLELGLLHARLGHAAAARASLDDALTTVSPLETPAVALEARAVSARLRAALGEVRAAREDAAAAAELAERFSVVHFGDKGWHLAAAYALLGDDAMATHFAQAAARSFVDEALSMGPDLVEAYARLPWHQHCFAFLAGRGVPLRLDDVG